MPPGFRSARSASISTRSDRRGRDEDRDRYEGRYRFAMCRFLADHPDDPEAEAVPAAQREWYEGYLPWGRDTMGFALYLLQRGRS